MREEIQQCGRRTGIQYHSGGTGQSDLPSAGGDGKDFDLKRVVNEELKARDGVVDYKIPEYSPERVLIKVTETTRANGSRGGVYRIQHEPRPDGTDDIHWEYLGSVADENPE